MDRSTDQQRLQLANLHTERNFSLPIFRLPPETLASVLILNARDYFESNLGHRTAAPPSWVNVSYVCSHWRNVALNCPALWTYHFTVSLRWTEALLVRSKQTSLKVHIRHSQFRVYRWWLALVKKLLKNLERIEELHLHLPDSLLPVEPLLRAPRLKILEIKVIGSHSLVDDPPGGPLGFIDWHTPLLHTLKLIICPLLLYRLKLGRLTTLCLQDIPFTLRQGIVDFLATLRCMHDLTFLTVHNALSESYGLLSTGELSASPTVDLPHLVHLSVIEPFSTVVALLSWVNIPLKAKVRLYSTYNSNFATSQTLSFLSQRFNTSEELSSGAAPRSLVISSTWRSPRFTFSALERDCALPVNVTDCTSNILLDLTFGTVPSAEEERYRIINDVCHCAPSTNLQSLHVVGLPLSLGFWRPLLTHLCGLRYLKLSNGYMPDLASLLSHPTDVREESLGGHSNRDQVSTADHIILPELEELELFRVTFSSEHDLPSGLICLESLLDALSTRQGLRDRLTMVECKAI